MKQVANYIFDIDGTITPSRGKIDQGFHNFLEHFCTHNAVFFVTGSDREKTLEQIGPHIYNLAIRVYQCSGNDVWKQYTNIRSAKWEPPQKLIDDLEILLDKSSFYWKGGDHIDIRPGLVNFSIPGRNASTNKRLMFVVHDKEYKEREIFTTYLQATYPELHVSVAGETGIDITPKTWDKSQILADFKPSEKIMFYGDKCQPGGNDYEIAMAIRNLDNGSIVHEVTGWEDTWQKLT